MAPPGTAPSSPRAAGGPATSAAGSPAPDNISVARWMALYGGLIVASGGVLAALLAAQGRSWAEWRAHPMELLAAAPPAVKLLAFAVYLSLCTTFLPLPTGWIVAAVAMRQAGVASNALVAATVVGAVGAAGSTLANLFDYHLFTWLLRRRRIARVRQTRLYAAAARWFARAPFVILVIFNIVPIPVDVIRMLATTCRYGRLPFAAANYAGRFVRYGVIAYVTHWLNLGRWAVVVLLALAVLLGAVKVLPAAARRLFGRGANGPSRGVSDT